MFNQITLEKGKLGEEHFLRYELWSLFKVFRKDVKDLRGEKHEGEILLPNGRLLEIKSDHNGGMKRTGNVVIETKDRGREGWFYWCQQHGVTDIIFEAFDNAKGEGWIHPYFVLHTPFHELVRLINEVGDTFRTLSQSDGSKLLLVPYRRILDHCEGASVLYTMYPDESAVKALTDLTRVCLQVMKKDGYIREEDAFIQWRNKEDECPTASND